MPTAHLADRGVLRVAGEEARTWLNNLVTCDVATLKPGEARLGALLIPQGKIIADFLISEAPDGAFLLDAPRGLVPDLLKRLTLYRLRAKIAIEDISEWTLVAAAWDAEPASGRGAIDGRLPGLGGRWILGRQDADLVMDNPGRVKASAYHAHRIALGIPEGGQDFAYGDTFPHEADMDQLGGIDFKKGCYVGQEVVSRMQHRGSGGRTRVVPVAYDGGFSASEGIEVKAGEKILGSTGSNANGRGLAKLRLDRVEDAIKAGETLTAGGIPLTLIKPDWATFRFPGEDAAS